MDEDASRPVDTSLAAHAFSELRGEVSLLRRAVERLTDERTAQPDYQPSLEAISKTLQDVCAWASRVSDMPALKLTRQGLTEQINAASKDSRIQDARLLADANQALKAAAAQIDSSVFHARTLDQQNNELFRNRIAFAVAGMALFAILPGACARSLPVSWAVPERIAARMLGKDMWSAGQDMMAKADPVRWRQILERERRVTPSPKN